MVEAGQATVELALAGIATTIPFTVIFIVVEAAHCPALGVKVYVVVPAVAVEITAGVQVPVIPLVDVFDRVPGVAH